MKIGILKTGAICFILLGIICSIINLKRSWPAERGEIVVSLLVIAICFFLLWKIFFQESADEKE